jgi:niacin transporter
MDTISAIAGLYRPLPAYRIEGLRWVLFLAGFTALATAAPAICHACKIAGIVFLPMHFAVFFAAMVMGVRGGVAAALLSPVISWGLSGMPPAHALMPITLELAVYAAVAGWLTHGRRMKPVPALLLAMAAGRILSIGAFLFNFGAAHSMPAHLKNLFIVGLPGIAMQIILLPPLASKAISYLKKE